MVPGVWDEGKQRRWGKGKETRSSHAICSPSSPFLLTLFDSLSYQALRWLTEMSRSWIAFLLPLHFVYLPQSFAAIAVQCRLSKVTVGLSGWWFGDWVIVWLFAYAFMCISESLHDFLFIYWGFVLAAPSVVWIHCMCCVLCLTCPMFTQLFCWLWISLCALGDTVS